jgi:hypothetical protein
VSDVIMILTVLVLSIVFARLLSRRVRLVVVLMSGLVQAATLFTRPNGGAEAMLRFEIVLVCFLVFSAAILVEVVRMIFPKFVEAR